MSEILKPCPFCGAEVQDDERGEKYPRKSPMGGWIIHCECCGASLSQFRKSGKGEISWNTRPIEDALNKRIAESEEAFMKLEDTLDDVEFERAVGIGRLNERIDELEAYIAKLIEAGRMMKQPDTIEEFHQGRRDYDALVAEWKVQE